MEEERGGPVVEEHVRRAFDGRDRGSARRGQAPQPLAQLLERAVIGFRQVEIEGSPLRPAAGVGEDPSADGDPGPLELVRAARSADDQPGRSQAAHVDPVSLGGEGAREHRAELSHPCRRVGKFVGRLVGFPFRALRERGGRKVPREAADDLARPRLVGAGRSREHEPVAAARAGGDAVLGKERRPAQNAVFPRETKLPFPFEKQVREPVSRERLDPSGEQS